MGFAITLRTQQGTDGLGHSVFLGAKRQAPASARCANRRVDLSMRGRMRWPQFVVHANYARNTGGDLHRYGYRNVGKHEPQRGPTGHRSVGRDRIGSAVTARVGLIPPADVLKLDIR